MKLQKSKGSSGLSAGADCFLVGTGNIPVAGGIWVGTGLLVGV